MKNVTGKLLLVLAGAALGTVGYIAWKNRDELHELLDAAFDKGKERIEQQVEDLGDVASETTATRERR